MNDLFIDPILPTLVLITILVFSVTLCTWIELKRNWRFKTLRFLSIFVLHLSLAGLFFQPYYNINVSDSFIVITDGYDANQLDSLIRTHPDFQVFSHRTQSVYDDIPEKVLLAKQSQIAFVLGYGFNRGTLDQLSATQFTQLTKSHPNGVLQISVEDKPVANNEAQINILINNESETGVPIIFSGPEGKIDSVKIDQRGIQTVNFRFLPKVEGDWVYHLKCDNAVIDFPVRVDKKSKLRILFLQQFPTFETRTIKEMLEADHTISARYQPSQNIFRYENINSSEQKFSRITPEVLQRYDLVIFDTDFLKTISNSEWKTFQEEVRNGLGLIVLFNESPVKNNRLGDLPVRFTSIPNDTAVFSVNGKTITLPAWPAIANDNTTSLIRNKSRTLAGFSSSGFGKVGFQLLQQTYQLSLRGDSLSYRSIWYDLIDRTSRANNKANDIEIENNFPIYPDEPVKIKLISNKETPVLFSDSIRVPLAEDVMIDGIWKGKVWLDQPGWHSLHVEGDTTRQSLFVSNKNHATSIAQFNQIVETSLRSKNSSLVRNEMKQRKDFPAWIFFGLMLLSCGCLWLLPKL